jgi:predicted enzyme related to lactoylglutathione lyase
MLALAFVTEIVSKNDGRLETNPQPAQPVSKQVTSIFIPVQDVFRAREWYRDVLGLKAGEIIAGHLCVIEMGQGPSLLLDQKLRPDGPVELSSRGEYPLFMFGTDDIEAALAYMRERSIEVVEYDGQVINNGHWFNFRDCEGNLLMMCA